VFFCYLCLWSNQICNMTVLAFIIHLSVLYSVSVYHLWCATYLMWLHVYALAKNEGYPVKNVVMGFSLSMAFQNHTHISVCVVNSIRATVPGNFRKSRHSELDFGAFWGACLSWQYTWRNY
jgi:hypothetical protein